MAWSPRPLVLFIWKARPEILEVPASGSSAAGVSMRRVLAVLAAVAVLTGGALSWFASAYPDGLEWSMGKTAGTEELAAPGDGVHSALAAVQEKTAFLPDYGFTQAGGVPTPAEGAAEPAPAWPAVDMGTSVSGLVGGALTLGAVPAWRAWPLRPDARTGKRFSLRRAGPRIVLRRPAGAPMPAIRDALLELGTLDRLAAQGHPPCTGWIPGPSSS